MLSMEDLVEEPAVFYESFCSDGSVVLVQSIWLEAGLACLHNKKAGYRSLIPLNGNQPLIFFYLS